MWLTIFLLVDKNQTDMVNKKVKSKQFRINDDGILLRKDSA